MVIVKSVQPTHERGEVVDDRTAMTEDAAMRLGGVSRRQLRYWSETGLLRPSISETLGPRTVVRLYSFADLLALLVAASLRQQFSLQHVRKIIEYLRAQGYARPLTELRFAIDGNAVYFQHPDGSWEGERRPGQIVLSHVIELEPLRTRIRESASGLRPRELRGAVERKRSVLGSKPVFAGTRTPVEALFPYLERRYSTARILEAYPHLSSADVKTARERFRESGAA